ncbi:GNAT family N-acetyltransferase [Leucobacter sp. L43]|uniref:GNAT family N-acetyltransferase n=1 Tax=Leucobacter sp. L43 TaxID=2798040 RepID=UPI0019073378|nr:GNAT family N-acetyltransferase [Leucobacter sp. L43]
MMAPGLLTLTFETPTAGDASETLSGRELRGYEEFRAAAALYVDVFQYRAPEFALNPNLLSALAQNGGSSVGVFTSHEELVGFAYGFAGRDTDGTEFHYSQAATVDPRFQGRGVGRMLKHLQAEVAEHWGHRTMRWTFDPLLARNAHFNFDSLGASGIAYLPDYYARAGTDRILVEWVLDDRGDREQTRTSPSKRRAPALGVHEWGEIEAVDDALWIAFPAVPPVRTEVASEMRSHLAASLTTAIDSGRVLVGCTRINDETAAYLAVPDIRMEQR